MPTQHTLEKFIARVVEGAHAEAIEEFYMADASMQENMGEPRQGRDALVAHERAALARAANVTSTCVRPVFVNGDHVVIRWILSLNGRTAREVASRSWPISAGRVNLSPKSSFSTIRGSGRCNESLSQALNAKIWLYFEKWPEFRGSP